jgi:hypothetical protein
MMLGAHYQVWEPERLEKALTFVLETTKSSQTPVFLMEPNIEEFSTSVSSYTVMT